MFIVAPECKETKTGSNSSTGKEKIDLPLLKKKYAYVLTLGLKKGVYRNMLALKSRLKNNKYRQT